MFFHDALVNLTVFDSNGVSHSRTSVPLVHAGEPKPEHGYFCEWMPYQIGQAAKAAASSAQVAQSVHCQFFPHGRCPVSLVETYPIRLSDVAAVSVWGVVRVEVGMVEVDLLEPSDFGRDDHGSRNCRYLFWGRP
jgi:hypothetical protein